MLVLAARTVPPLYRLAAGRLVVPSLVEVLVVLDFIAPALALIAARLCIFRLHSQCYCLLDWILSSAVTDMVSLSLNDIDSNDIGIVRP